jgi:hypothetical protein
MRATSSVGSGCRGSSPATCGTTRCGTSWPRGRSGSAARPARSTSYPWRWGTALPCTSTPESSQQPRRSSRKPTRSRRRPGTPR